MKLTDVDILELNELCNALIDGPLNEKQAIRLSHWLCTSLEARQFYIRAMGVSASLFSYASEMQIGEPACIVPRKRARHAWRMIASSAIAASVAVLLWLGWTKYHAAPDDSHGLVSVTALAMEESDFVARLTGSKDCQWAKGMAGAQAGAQLHKDQRVDLVRGFAQITFDSGAQVVLQGPASLTINSAWSAKLNSGVLNATVPHEAIGFSISSPTVEVVDLGTEFSMFADPRAAATEVLVLKGEVEAASSAPGDQTSVLLHQSESRLFAASGVSTVPDAGTKLADLRVPATLDRAACTAIYAHWTLHEADALNVDPAGAALKATNFQLQRSAKADVAARDFVGALQFDGQLFARAIFPGISNNSPHTVAFWINVPKDAELSNAYAMIGWTVNKAQLGSHAIEVCWNRRPSEGTLGALRTDYGGGFAMGATNLRDGRWHHVAVVLTPAIGRVGRIDVRQYVDGRLEGQGRQSPAASSNANASAGDGPVPPVDAVWLGCRLGAKGLRAGRFLGQIKDLFIADTALEQPDILRLMTPGASDSRPTPLP